MWGLLSMALNVSGKICVGNHDRIAPGSNSRLQNISPFGLQLDHNSTVWQVSRQWTLNTSDRYLELGQSCPGSLVADQVIISYGLPLSWVCIVQPKHISYKILFLFFSLSGMWQLLSVPSISFWSQTNLLCPLYKQAELQTIRAGIGLRSHRIQSCHFLAKESEIERGKWPDQSHTSQ